MMITAALYFDNGVDTGSVVGDLQALPALIRPIYFAEDEGKIIAANVLTDETRFEKFRKKNPTGFFLYADDKTFFDISARRVGYAEVTLYLAEGLPDELATAFFKCLIGCKPVFGFACEYQEPVPDANGSYVVSNGDAEGEYYHRNRHYITIGKNHVESWIGRNLEKYIPGVYWYTLLSDGLLTKHGVKLADLVAESMATEILGDGSLHLLKFFASPEDWKENADRLDNLCERVEGVFSRRSVEKAVAGITNYLEYDEAIAQWR
jgi:hypothetical protein